jgi:hypothetical protein
LGFSDISVAKWCNVLLGLLIVLLNAWIIFGYSMMPLHVAEQPSKKEQTKNKK